jgi:hypothetical protein
MVQLFEINFLEFQLEIYFVVVEVPKSSHCLQIALFNLEYVPGYLKH